MSNEQRTPISRTFPLAAQRAALLEIEQRGYALPCHVTAIDGQIVTVAFDVTGTGAPLPPCTMAIAGAEYIRFPTQINDKGVAEPASVDISIVTGLGPANSLPSFRVRPANLSALVFKPVGNAKWAPSPNPNAVVLYGPDGVIIQDKSGTSPDFSITVNSSGITAKAAGSGPSFVLTSSSITMTAAGHSVEINSTGILMDGHLYANHEHLPGTYVAGSTAVTGDSAGVVPGT